MKKSNQLALITLQLIGYVWYLSVYVVIIPFFVLVLSKGLDYLVFNELLGIDFNAMTLGSEFLLVYKLFALVLFALGLLIFLEATITLYTKTKGFPFSMLPHQRLQPKKLAMSGVYGRVRHPMLLGYLIMLTTLGLVEYSPAMVLWWVPLLGACFTEYYKLTEERKLFNWFGEEYAQYRKKVPALIPRFSPKD